MKKILLCVSIFTVLLTSSCGGDSDSEAVVVNGCSSSINSFFVEQNGDRLDFNISATAGALYYEVSISSTDHNNGPDNGSIQPLDFETNSLSLSNVYGNGDMVIYARTVCGDNSKGAWFGPKLISIDPYCETPTELNVNQFGFSWNYSGFTSQQPSNFQVQYGPQGFNPGSGTTATVNDFQYNGASLSAGQAYDFYVRAYCTNGVGYGNWAGPFTYFSENNQNMCLPPINISAVYEGSSTYSFHYNPNGEDQWEYTIVTRNSPLDSGTIYTRHWNGGWPAFQINTNYNYDFYIRTVCSDGSRTEWTLYQLNP